MQSLTSLQNVDYVPLELPARFSLSKSIHCLINFFFCVDFEKIWFFFFFLSLSLSRKYLLEPKKVLVAPGSLLAFYLFLTLLTMTVLKQLEELWTWV
jgi:hypothetical protein